MSGREWEIIVVGDRTTIARENFLQIFLNLIIDVFLSHQRSDFRSEHIMSSGENMEGRLP